jgi:acetyl-CoA synthetase
MPNNNNNHQEKIYPVPKKLLSSSKKPFISSFEQYKSLWQESVDNPSEYFSKAAREYLHWNTDFKTTCSGDFENGNVAWFLEGELNAAYNCVDRHAFKTPDKIAIIHEGDDPNSVRKITYKELMQEVCKMANVLSNLDVRKGDNVAIYMPMIPETAIAMLACARLGAVHSVVFAGFSAESLHERIQNCGARVVITSDEGRRGGKFVATKRIVDEALQLPNIVDRVIVVKHTRTGIPMTPNRDIWWHEEMASARPYHPVTVVNSEDPLFLLYTSGSTGTPKGVLHTTAGYLLGAAMTVKNIFDIHDDDIYACMADLGWITVIDIARYCYSIYNTHILHLSFRGTLTLFMVLYVWVQLLFYSSQHLLIQLLPDFGKLLISTR